MSKSLISIGFLFQNHVFKSTSSSVRRNEAAIVHVIPVIYSDIAVRDCSVIGYSVNVFVNEIALVDVSIVVSVFILKSVAYEDFVGYRKAMLKGALLTIIHCVRDIFVYPANKSCGVYSFSVCSFVQPSHSGLPFC